MISGKRFWLLLFTALLILLAYAFWHKPKAVAVKIYRVAPGEVKETVANTRVGTVKACRRTYLAPATGGQVAKLHVREGDKVKPNQLLLEVWNQDLKAQVDLQQAQIKSARANANQACVLAAGAKREAVRLAKLQKINQLVSEEQVDQAVTDADAKRAFCHASNIEIEVGQAKLKMAEAAVERTLVTAPFAGVVAEINAELGEFVTPSPPGIPTLPPIDLLDISCLYVSAPIDEVDAPKLKTGMQAFVSLDAFAEKRCSGTVSRIAPYVLEKEKQARTVEVEVKLTDPEDLAALLPGYSADIEVLLAKKDNALRIPTEAVLENNRVLLLDADGLLVERSFQPGLANWSFTEVLSGLQKGDKVVLSVGREGVAAGVHAVEER
ncbi:efflux RND transporter periplasmic adaptor subunit [Methylomarinum vadi]|uniref:efflux RND transporter periplasmic adaptor subunit n=1 Tax=Methylomarinum vadi TaxID=438855 RepID=UPI0004DEE04B|nr:efflux RND transporter periplasmic adaptor subunit [Methylomarinum vadi]